MTTDDAPLSNAPDIPVSASMYYNIPRLGRYVYVDVSLRGRELDRGGTLHSTIARQRSGQPPRVIVVSKREGYD